MAVQNDTSRIQYNGNNSTVNAYAIPFPFFENSHIRAVVTTSAGVDTELALGSGFTLTGAGNPNGGSLVTVAAVPATSKVTIFRNVPATQTTSYQEGGDFPAASHERALDKLTMLAQQTKRLADRALKVPETQNNPSDLPNAGSGQKLLGSNNGVITWEDNRQLPQYPATSGTNALVTAGNGTPPIWQTIPSIATGPITATGTTTPRFLADRFAERLNVVDFGADPTGVTSSRSAFIAAIAATPSGGYLFIPKGIYRDIYLIDITKPIVIVGEHPSQTILDVPDFDAGGNVNSQVFGLKGGCTLFHLESLKIQYTQPWSAGRGRSEGIIAFASAPKGFTFRVRNVEFYNIVECISCWQAQAGIFNVTDCRFSYLHGYASCRFGKPLNELTINWIGIDWGSHPWTVCGQGRYTWIHNNEWNGLLDDTFTGVSSIPPLYLRTCIDNFYVGGSANAEQTVVTNNFIRNHGVEAIILKQVSRNGSWLNPNDGTCKGAWIVANNIIFGPRRVSNYSKGVTPAIVCAGPQNAIVDGNQIFGSYTGITVNRGDGTQSRITGYDSNDTLRVEFQYPDLNHREPEIANGLALRFVSLGFKDPGLVLDLDTVYYVVQAQAVVLNASTAPANYQIFKLSLTPGGTPINLGGNFSSAYARTLSDYNASKIQVTNNTISHVVVGIQVSHYAKDQMLVAGNSVHCSSLIAKDSSGYFDQDIQILMPPNTNGLTPLGIYNGGATVENNVMTIGSIGWDGVFTVVSRGGVGNNILTLAAGQVASYAAARGYSEGVQINGFLTTWNENGVYNWPITGFDVSGNTLTIDGNAGFFWKADTWTSGTVYWTKTQRTPSSNFLVAVEALSNGGAEIVLRNNTFNTKSDVYLQTGSPPKILMENNVISDLVATGYNQFSVFRPFITESTRMQSLNLFEGEGVPNNNSAPHGSLYLRKDGDSSTSLYIKTPVGWRPFATYEP